MYVHLCELSGHTKVPVAIAWAILPSSLNVSMESDGGVELSEGLSMDMSSSLSCSNCCLELDWGRVRWDPRAIFTLPSCWKSSLSLSLEYTRERLVNSSKEGGLM